MICSTDFLYFVCDWRDYNVSAVIKTLLRSARDMSNQTFCNLILVQTILITAKFTRVWTDDRLSWKCMWPVFYISSLYVLSGLVLEMRSHCSAEFCVWYPVIPIESVWLGVQHEGEKLPHVGFAHFQFGHMNLQRWPPDSCLVWKWRLCELCFMHH